MRALLSSKGLTVELSHRVQNIKPSKAEGKDIIGLGVGEPDFDTPQHIKDAAIAAIHAGFTKYTAVGGTPSLKKAVIDKFKRENGLDYAPNQILVSCGGKQSFYNLAQAVINPGDEVIIPAPYWVSYPDMVILADGQPVIVEAGIDQASRSPRRSWRRRSPAHPDAGHQQPLQPHRRGLHPGRTGRPRRGAAPASPGAHRHRRHVRAHPLDDQPFANILNACPDLYDRTMVLNGVSKAYAMTGWRIGYAAGPARIIAAMDNIQSQSTSNPTSISQVAAEMALNGDQACIQPMLAAFKERHRFRGGRPQRHPRREVRGQRRCLLRLPGCQRGHPQTPCRRQTECRQRPGPHRISAGTRRRWCPAPPSAPKAASASPSPPQWIT
jgi:aspartate aminotransferase